MNTLMSKFETKWTPEPYSGCWLWTGATTNGYGVIRRVSKGVYLAHRVSHELFIGEIPSGMCVCHSCDTPSCVNPGHLFLGTREDNNKDKMSKGRFRAMKGENNGFSKLTESDVSYIRSVKGDKYNRKGLSDLFKVSDSAITRAKNLHYWKHVC